MYRPRRQWQPFSSRFFRFIHGRKREGERWNTGTGSHFQYYRHNALIAARNSATRFISLMLSLLTHLRAGGHDSWHYVMAGHFVSLVA